MYNATNWTSRWLPAIWIWFLMLGVEYYADVPKKPPAKVQLLSPEETTALLKANERDAIVLGSGSVPVYAFVDPECSASRGYVTFISKMLERNPGRNRFYLFLYHLDGKPSEEYITTILGSDTPEFLLKTHMVGNNNIALKPSDSDTDERVERIAVLAKRIGVYMRPYIITDGKVRNE